MTKKERSQLGQIQDLVGSGLSIYQNDRSSQRADLLIPMFREAFDLCVQILGKYPPENPKAGAR